MRKYTTLTSFVSIIWGPKKGPSVIGLLGVLAWYAKELGAVGAALLFDLRAVGRQALPASAFLYGCHAANNGSSAMLALDQGVVTFLKRASPTLPTISVCVSLTSFFVNLLFAGSFASLISCALGIHVPKLVPST
jgi:hypothetical protein